MPKYMTFWKRQITRIGIRSMFPEFGVGGGLTTKGYF